MDKQQLFLDVITGKAFEDSKRARKYYFHPPIPPQDGPQLVIANTNTRTAIGGGFWDCYTFKDNGQLKAKIGSKDYLIEKVIVPYTDQGKAEIHLKNKYGNIIRLIQTAVD